MEKENGMSDRPPEDDDSFVRALRDKCRNLWDVVHGITPWIDQSDAQRIAQDFESAIQLIHVCNGALTEIAAGYDAGDDRPVPLADIGKELRRRQGIAQGALKALRRSSAAVRSASRIPIMVSWQPIKTAPKDGSRILLFTSDFGAVEGWWDAGVQNFYASQVGWASYDPQNANGDWVSDFRPDDDKRLYCGCTPHQWATLPVTPSTPASSKDSP
jgi:hypothetical protein